MKDSFVVIELGGSQHIVSVGDELVVNRIEGKVGDSVSIDKVLLKQTASKTEVGSPYLDYNVSAKIISQFRGKKMHIRTYKAKSRYRRKIGHRQQLTKLEITRVVKKSATKSSSSKSPAKAAKTASKSTKSTAKAQPATKRKSTTKTRSTAKKSRSKTARKPA